MRLYRQEYWSGLPHPPPGDLPDLRIELGSPALRADFLPWKSPERYFLKSEKKNWEREKCLVIKKKRKKVVFEADPGRLFSESCQGQVAAGKWWHLSPQLCKYSPVGTRVWREGTHGFGLAKQTVYAPTRISP